MEDEPLLRYFIRRTDDRLAAMDAKLNDLASHKHYLLGQVRIVSVVFSTLTSTVIAIVVAIITQYLKS